MMSSIDLHIHSKYSDDGELSPSELMQKCAAAGVRLASLSDHNSVRGIAEARQAAGELGIDFVSGIEIDCQFHDRFYHVLGYGIDESAVEFAELDAKCHAGAVRQGRELIGRVRRLGMRFEDAAVEALAVNGVITGEMIGEAVLKDERNERHNLLKPLREGGSRSDNPYVNFYWDFCAPGKKAYVKQNFMSVYEAVQLIRRQGGKAVLAHPACNLGEDVEVLASVVSQGISGIEVYSSYHNERQMALFRQKADEYGLFMTAGSDFHGKTKPSVKIGGIECPEAGVLADKFRVLLGEK